MIEEAKLPDTLKSLNHYKKYGEYYVEDDVEDFLASDYSCAKIYYPNDDHRSTQSIYRAVRRYIAAYSIPTLDVVEREDEVYLIRLYQD